MGEDQGREPEPFSGISSGNQGLESVAASALAFRRYVLRRAYATYYAVWAITLFLYILVPYLLISTFGPSVLIDSVAVSMVIVAGLAASAVTSWRFRKEARAAALRRALRLRSRRAGHRWMPMLWWWGAFIAAAAWLVVDPGIAIYAVIYALLLLMDVQLYSWLARSFPDGIPLEGRLAVFAYGAGAVASIGISFVNGFAAWASAPWSIVVVTWLFSAFYALRSAPGEYVTPPG